MQVHRNIEQLPAFKNSVITIGTFDGVHQGHRKIIAALKKEAERIDGETVIITFDPHPRKVIQPQQALQLINTLEEKITLLEETGLDHLVVATFTRTFSEQTADEYICDFLIKKFHPASIIIGYDHHFGKGRTGNYKLLEEKSAQYNYRLIEIPKHVLDEIDVSSTQIRKAISESDIATANRLLGYSFFFAGEVVQGDKLGRALGYPTANLQYTSEEKIHLGHGVYAVYAEVDGERKKGMLSIGTRPTLNDVQERIEVNLFEFNKEIYGKKMKVAVEHYLRSQEKYPSLEMMVEQLHKDKAQSLRLLEHG